MTSPVPCPNCGNLVGPGDSLCPHCGAALLPASQAPSPTWPPPPVDAPFYNPYAPPPPKLVTGVVWGDVALGIVLTLASLFIGGLGLLIMPVVYFIVRPNTPVFGRAIGYTLLVIAALLLGALALCFYSLGQSSHY